MIYKTIFQLPLYAAVLYLNFWVFNEINPWIGILIDIAVASSLINKLYKFLNKKTK